MGSQIVSVTLPNSSGPYQEALLDSVVSSNGTVDAGKVVITDTTGLLNPTVIPNILPIGATEVLYASSAYPTVESALDSLLYVPIQITFTNNTNSLEIGTASAAIDLVWTYNKTMTSQSINQGIGAVALTSFSYSVAITSAFTTSETWTLTAGDGTHTLTASTTVAALPKVYWGVSALTSLTNAEILALGGSALSATINQLVTYNCASGGYPYFCYPSSFGLPTSVLVGGLTFSDFTLTTQAVTNAAGFTQTYNVIRFNPEQHAAALTVFWG